jgi:hypothetical protein
MDFNDEFFEAELERVLQPGYQIATLRRKIHEAVEYNLREYDLHSAHYAADLCLLRLVLELARDHPQQELIEEIVEVWRTVGKVRPTAK